MRMIGVDVGGTFTDVVLFDSATSDIMVHKVASTPDDPSRAVMAGLRAICERHDVPLSEIGVVLHGTTVATNAALEHKGAKTGMITNEGFRDVLHIARHQRPQHYSIMQEVPWQDRPLVRRQHRKTVKGRLIPPRGEVLEALDEDGVRKAALQLKEEGVEAIAVAFLFSYLDPVHEERARALVQEVCPEAFVVTSNAVSPQFREFERFTTTALCAFIGPKVRGYIGRLERSLAESGVTGELRIMASNGGVATAAMAAERPIVTLLSGLAAGVLGGAWVGGMAGRSDLITLDIGGTSADIGLIRDGQFGEASPRDTWIAGFPLMVPMLDIHTIGAGGGSIAFVDPGGKFRVGPQSAGAVPGPAAYGQGGDQPTVTDANLVLGRLDADNFLGGGMSLDVEASTAAVDRLAATLGLDRMETALGIITVINANMANAIRSRTVQKGIDPRGMALVAFGGGGPLQGAEIAESLGMTEVLVPLYPGLTSALGLMTTDLRYDALKTAFQIKGSYDLLRLAGDLGALEADIAGRFAHGGVARDAIRFERSADVRYVGQGYELRVPLGDALPDETALAALEEAFHRRHEQEYGHRFADSPIEIVNLRLTGRAEVPTIGRPAFPSGERLADALIRETRCVFRRNGETVSLATGFYHRDRLPIGEDLPGPVVILQTDSTTLVPPGWRARLDPSGNLLLTRKAPS
ncbi:hydantoinase/oxoprolinase family protein [Marinivivus vitaminiproducens]|uniref:hydantoinase/oxoprolinase family protein n=1 Tax=Marinivivus vitaminiproducens TaxID=3035935 RepID=UPI002798B39F|nr:hydantoinase/oxoprolinase family protein [Geminicoccaceae bacterium SCSIO 64248]